MCNKKIKNTRLVYNDEKNLKIYQALPAEDFKEFFMAYLTYNVGDNMEITDFSNPIMYGLFMQFKDKIDYNETKWEKQAAARRENGKKGGRPKKSALQEVTSTEFDLPKTDENAENENKADLSHFNPQDDNQYQIEGQMPSNGLKTGKEEDLYKTILREDKETINKIIDLVKKSENYNSQGYKDDADEKLTNLLGGKYDLTINDETAIKIIEYIRTQVRKDDIDNIPCIQDGQLEEVVEYDNYEEEIYNLIESEDWNLVKNIIEKSVEYCIAGKNEYEQFYYEGERKIAEIASVYNFSPKAENDFKTYCKKYGEIHAAYIENEMNDKYNKGYVIAA